MDKVTRTFAFVFFLTNTSFFLVNDAFSESLISRSGFVDLNVYPIMSDVDSDNTITVNIASTISDRVSYFSLSNFSDQEGKSKLSGIDSYYTEQNIRWKVTPTSPLDLTLQMNFRSGSNNDRHRLGVRWRLNDTPVLSDFFRSNYLSYSINLHAIQFDHESGRVWQMEHVFRVSFPYLSERLALSGFVDHTFNQELPDGYPSRPVVGEAQLSYRLFDNLHAIAEYRLNEYRRSDVNNLALGVEYKLSW